MKTIGLLLAAAWACPAAITNFRVLGTTATQALIAYTAPNGSACSIQVSLSSGLTPAALDVDPNTFANSNLDLSRSSTMVTGLSRTVVIGQRTAQYATAGTYSGVRHFSRALQPYTPYFGQITCPSTGDTLPFSFTTSNIPLGQTYGDPWVTDPAHPGVQPWPECIDSGTSQCGFNDPQFGTYQQQVGVRGNNWGYWNNMALGTAYDQGQTPCDTAGPWTSPCAFLTGGNTTIGDSQVPLILRPPLAGGNAWNGGMGSYNYGNAYTLDQLALSLTGSCTSSNSAFCKLDVAISMNGGASSANYTSSVQQVTLTSSSATQTAGQANTSTLGTIPWLLDTFPRFNVEESSPNSGQGTISGDTLTWTSGTNYFSNYWVTGGNGRIDISTSNNACTAGTEYFITGMPNGQQITLSGTPPTGTVYWCELNFAIMVWRDQLPTDGSTITLTGASLAAIESGFPTYPDNGDGTGCMNTMVSAGFWCLYGGIEWINPSTGQTAYYGYADYYSGCPQGNLTANCWSGFGNQPTGETSNIDQTQSVLTWYFLANDPATGNPMVIQGVFNPSTISQPTVAQFGGAEIQNASITSTTAYSVAYSNGLTFTNMTPQSLSATIPQQMATFDATFNPSQLDGYGSYNCSPYGMEVSQLFITCYSLGLDSPAWLIAWTPGDGNPAHAGQSSGPRVVGAINTFNIPEGPVGYHQVALVGHSFHALVETGETGWVQLNGHADPPITTSNSSVATPGSRAACSTFTGLSGVSGTCVAIQMSSYTHDSVTGYEPYYANPSPPFLGTPGEVRTTQIGDTACVAASSTGSCDYVIGGNELMTLEAKNYGGTQGLSILQSNSYSLASGGVAVTGPLTLYWQSPSSWAIAPNAQSNSAGAETIYWYPLGGCAGSPDPHGNCLIQDTNDTIAGHGEWRNGGEAVATNVPAWEQSIWGWPTDYQVIQGSVPGILELGQANLTPNLVSGVNYVSSDPPFDGIYGHPWGFDGGSHTNPGGANVSNTTAFDNMPVQGGGYEPTFALVTGQLYSATPSSNTDADDIWGYGSYVPINRKVFATGASCGAHPLVDQSGPGSSIGSGTSANYQYCIARVSGECQPGSSVGEIFVNCPDVVSTACSGSGIHGGTPLGVGNDICIGNQGIAANAIRQFSLPYSDENGLYTRTLATATSWLRMVFGFENNRALPDNSWLLYRQEFLDYARPEMWMMKLPLNAVLDSLNRGTFVPITIQVTPPSGLAVNNAIVEFGYQEYGAPQLINCTTRNDSCIASASAIPQGTVPFYFASENPTGAPCSSGCTLAIPAISQRILFFRVQYRNASNGIISSGPISAIIVP